MTFDFDRVIQLDNITMNLNCTTLSLFYVLQEGGNEQQDSVKVLATTFKNGKEIKRKIYSVQSTNQLLEKTSKLGFVLDRILKFNTDFQEFTDVDSSVQICNFDKFQVHFSEAPHLQPVAREASQTQFLLLIFFCQSVFQGIAQDRV